MFVNTEDHKVKHGVSWKVTFNKDNVTIIARNLKTEERKMCEYSCEYNFQTGYREEDIIEVYRLVDEICEELRKT